MLKLKVPGILVIVAQLLDRACDDHLFFLSGFERTAGKSAQELDGPIDTGVFKADIHLDDLGAGTAPGVLNDALGDHSLPVGRECGLAQLEGGI